MSTTFIFILGGTTMTKERANIDEQLLSTQRAYESLAARKRHGCMHKPSNRGQLIPLKEFKGYVKNKDKYPESTGICTACHTLFDMGVYETEELDSFLFMALSMIEQVKNLTNMTDDDWEEINRVYEAYDVYANFITYYSDMLKKLREGEGKRKKRNNNENEVGNIGFGVTRNMYKRNF